MGGAEGGYKGGESVWRDGGAEVSGVNRACHPVFVGFDPLKYG